MLVALLAVTKHQTKQLKPRRLIKAPAGRRQEQEVAGHSDIINWQADLSPGAPPTHSSLVSPDPRPWPWNGS